MRNARGCSCTCCLSSVSCYRFTHWQSSPGFSPDTVYRRKCTSVLSPPTQCLVREHDFENWTQVKPWRETFSTSSFKAMKGSTTRWVEYGLRLWNRADMTETKTALLIWAEWATLVFVRLFCRPSLFFTPFSLPLCPLSCCVFPADPPDSEGQWRNVMIKGAVRGRLVVSCLDVLGLYAQGMQQPVFLSLSLGASACGTKQNKLLNLLLQWCDLQVITRSLLKFYSGLGKQKKLPLCEPLGQELCLKSTGFVFRCAWTQRFPSCLCMAFEKPWCCGLSAWL